MLGVKVAVGWGLGKVGIGVVGKSRRNFGGKAFGVSSKAGPCPGRVLRLVAGDADLSTSRAGDALAARAAAYVDGHIIHRVALWPLLLCLLLRRSSARVCRVRSAAPPGFWDVATKARPAAGTSDIRLSLPSPHPALPAEEIA